MSTSHSPSEQLQVPRCKHLRGPDLDCTHSNTGQESQAKTVPSATAEEIQGLTSNPKSFLFRGHRKYFDSVWKRLNQDCKALQRVVRLAERISGSALPSLQDIYLKRCKSRAAKIKDSNHPVNHLFILHIYLLLFSCVVLHILHCPLSGPDLIYISLLIIFSLIEYVTNKKKLETWRKGLRLIIRDRPIYRLIDIFSDI